MTGNDDFFGGSITPPLPTPSPGVRNNPHMVLNKEYASYGPTATAPKAATNSSLPLIVGAIAIALVGAIALAGYRMLFGGTQIEMPDTLLGMDKVEAEAPAAQALESSLDDLTSELGVDVDIQVGLYESPDKMLFVMGGEVGTDDVEGGAEEYFAGFEQGVAQGASGIKLTDADAGTSGGQMKCLDVGTGGSCAWIDDDVFGAFAMAPLATDPAQTAQQIRNAIEK